MNIGDTAPDFVLPDHMGRRWQLSEALVLAPVVLFFYPGAMTIGCTAETCHFRDLGAEFAALGATRVGVSADPANVQREFATRTSVDFPLLSDEDGFVGQLYGARRNFALRPGKRATFVIGMDASIRGIITSELRMQKHADEALGILRSTFVA